MFGDDPGKMQEHEEDFEDAEFSDEVQEENVQLRMNFQNLKEIHLKSQETAKQLQRRYNALYQERVEVERQYQQLCESWRLELEEKQKQFDEARAQIMQPKDLEMLRLKVLEEVEAPFKQKCHSLAKEAETTQQAYVQLRREHEKLRNQITSMEARHREREDEIALEHESEMQKLRDEVVQLRSSTVPRMEADRKATALRQEVKGAEVLVERLREEIADLRKEREAAVAEKDAAFAECEKKMFHLRESDLNMSGQVESLLRKNRHLAKQLEEAGASKERMHADLVKIQAEGASLQGQLAEFKRQMESERSRAEERMGAISRMADTKKAELNNEVIAKSSRIAELELQLREQAHQMSVSNDENARLAAEKHESERLVLEAQMRTLVAQISSLEAELKREQKNTEELRLRADGDVRSAKDAADRAQRACDALQIDKERLRAEVAESQATLERAGRWPEERHSMEEQLKEQQVATASLLADKEALEAEMRSKDMELKEYQELWGSEAAANIRALEDAKRAWALEKSLLVKKASQQTQRGSDKLKSELARHQKKVQQYKHAVGILKEEKAELVLKVNELETRMSSMQVGSGTHSRRGSHPGPSPSPLKPRAVLEILNDMQAIKRKQHAYLEK